MDRVCSIPGCAKPYFGRSFCQAHYTRWRRYGDPLIGARKPRSKCSVAGCDAPLHGRTFCSVHYARSVRYGDPLAGRTGFGEVARFFRQVVLPWDEDRCLPWPYHRNGNGYAEMRRDGRSGLIVSRIVCEHVHGPAPTPDHEAAHSCGQGRNGCVNPRHLSWKTPKQNAADRVTHGTHPLGERNPNVKLKDAEVSQILELKGLYSLQKIADMFGVTKSTIFRVMAGERAVSPPHKAVA